MRKVTTCLLAVCMTLFSTVALASTALSWEAPTTRVDGTAFSVSEIARYELCANETEAVGCKDPLTIDGAIKRVALTDIVRDYQARHFSIRVVDTDGLVSQWSDSVLGKLLAPPESPFLRLTQ